MTNIVEFIICYKYEKCNVFIIHNKTHVCKMQQRFMLKLKLSIITVFVIIFIWHYVLSLLSRCCAKHIDNWRLYVETLMILRSNIHIITFKSQKSNVSFKQFSVDFWWNQHFFYFILSYEIHMKFIWNSYAYIIYIYYNNFF